MKNIKTSEQDKYPMLNRILRERELDYLAPGNKPVTLRQATAIRDLIAPDLTVDELFDQEQEDDLKVENDMDDIIVILKKLKPEQVAYVKKLLNELFAS